MEAFRKIVVVKDNILKVELPDSFNGRQVELIVLPAEEGITKVDEPEADYFSLFYGKINSELSEEEVDKKLKSLRQEWNRDLS